MTRTATGMFAGILLAIAAAVGGFGYFLLAVVFGVIGFAIAGQLSGELDVRAVFGGRTRG